MSKKKNDNSGNKSNKTNPNLGNHPVKGENPNLPTFRNPPPPPPDDSNNDSDVNQGNDEK